MSSKVWIVPAFIVYENMPLTRSAFIFHSKLLPISHFQEKHKKVVENIKVETYQYLVLVTDKINLTLEAS